MSQHFKFERTPYQTDPQSLSVLAPALGLPANSTAKETKDELDTLLVNARRSSLEVNVSRAVQLVELATEPPFGSLDFLEVRTVFFERAWKSLKDVESAVHTIRQALETPQAAASSPVAQSSRHGSSLEGGVLPPMPEQGLNHISTLLEYVLHRYEVTRGLPEDNEQ